jgi:hypothetical protein
VNNISEIFAVIAATLVTIPLLGLYFVYLAAVKTTRNKVFSLKLAVDCTALLFMAAVYFLILEIWGVHLLWVFILFFLASAVIFTIMHWKVYEDIYIRKVIKGVWRFQFFVFLLAYFALILYGMFTSIYAFAAE